MISLLLKFPLVCIKYTFSKPTLSIFPMLMISMMIIIGRMVGTLICRIRCILPAPSKTAASCNSFVHVGQSAEVDDGPPPQSLPKTAEHINRRKPSVAFHNIGRRASECRDDLIEHARFQIGKRKQHTDEHDRGNKIGRIRNDLNRFFRPIPADFIDE